ncbi:MAG: hypothetical protein PVI90_09505 [Desulfobacteraceae bacterium]|jgi:hypothetical protein
MFSVKKKISGILFIALIILYTAFCFLGCGSKLEGTYEDESGLMRFEFKPDDKVYMNAMGSEIEVKYKINGEKVKIIMPNGMTQEMTIQDDGSIDGPGGTKLTLKEE